MTLNDLSEGHITAAVGFLPLVPSGALRGVRRIAKWNDVAIDLSDDALDMLRRTGIAKSYDKVVDLLQDWKTLATNMRHAGIPRPPKTHAHHIVAKRATYVNAARARCKLAELGVSTENAVNGVYLDVHRHMHLHTHKYYDTIWKRIQHVKSKEELVEKMNAIRDELLTRGLFR